MTRAARRARKPKFTARNADRHRLYEMAVQDPGVEVDRLGRIFRSRTGRPALALREDFCGTANLCTAWVRSRGDRTATGLDLDRETLEWGRWNNLAPLGDDAWRITLRNQDVRDPVPERFDIAAGLNFSYSIFKTRDDLRRYFRSVYDSLTSDGMLFIDVLGGWEAQQEIEEERREDGFTYVWEQRDFNPIDNTMTTYIHFRFDDGSEMRRAFRYDWRLWQVVELREVMAEAGFDEIDVYWEDEDEDRNDLGTFRRRKRAPNDPGWNCYVVGKKNPGSRKNGKSRHANGRRGRSAANGTRRGRAGGTRRSNGSRGRSTRRRQS
jgi:SAM-dependent methyltransferase